MKLPGWLFTIVYIYINNIYNLYIIIYILYINIIYMYLYIIYKCIYIHIYKQNNKHTSRFVIILMFQRFVPGETETKILARFCTTIVKSTV